MSFQHSKKENPQTTFRDTKLHGTPRNAQEGEVRPDCRQLEDQHYGSKEGSRGRRGVVPLVLRTRTQKRAGALRESPSRQIGG